jgi:dTDP-4-amino-4,6-dideoxygalactose transaminase
MSNVLAGIGRGQMEVLEMHISLRRENNKFYHHLFENIKGVRVLEEFSLDYFSNHWLTCVMIDKQKASFDNEE